MKFLIENIHKVNLLDLESGSGFVDIAPKKRDNLDSSKLINFALQII